MATILVIEDDEALRTLIREALARAGHSVFEAGNGHEAVAIVQKAGVNMVLTDLVMPEQDGFEVIMTLRSRVPAVPVIAMSGGRTSAQLYLDIARKLGARAILTKPFSPEELHTAIASALGAG